ncbi:DegV family protein [Petrachloros mirabilis]
MRDTRRRVVIATDAGVNLRAGLAEQFQILVVPRLFQTAGRAHLSAINPRQLAVDETLSNILPARTEDFVNAYSQVEHTHIVTIHLPWTLDTASAEARRARDQLGDRQEILVYEARTTEAGVSFLVETASRFLRHAANSSPDQIVAFLKQAEQTLVTYLLVNDQVETGATQELPISEDTGRMYQIDAVTGELEPVLDIPAAFQKVREPGHEVIVQWQRADENETARRVSAATRHIGSESFEIREISSKNSAFPRSFIGYIRVPNRTLIHALEQVNNPVVVLPRLVSPESGREYTLRGEQVHLGRSTKESPFVGIDLAEEKDKGRSVSRHHATVIHPTEGEWILEVDPSSLNGTYINGALVKKGERKLIEDGDKLMLGDVILVFQVEKYNSGS